MQDYLNIAHNLADLARPIAKQYFGQSVPVDMKADNSPVTLADKEIEMAIRQHIMQHCPDHGILGEEMDDHQTDAEYVWVIDPIDGTKAFVGQKPTFTTLIALCKDGAPILGVIDQPIKQERWTSDMTTSSETPSDIEKLSDCMIATTSFGYFSSSQMIVFQELERATRSTLLNHDAYAYGMLSEGDLEIVLDVKLKPYDFCALVPVIEQAGGIITDWHGKPLTMRSEGHVIATANKSLHKQALDLLSKAA
ncbi:MAG: inositol monophosphatase family protein [Rickettsiales bacterium]|nr:inositol monophosphatase family protein [Rickettsiales bacterium]